MAEVKWIKINTDMFDNRKIRHLRKLPEGDRIVLIWVMLLTMAGRCNANGMIFLTENIPYTTRMLADELGFEESTIILAVEALQRLGMLSMNNDVICIDGWLEHQNIERLSEIREYNRIAKQKQRAKLKAPQDNVKDNVKDMSRTCQRCQDIEEERDSDKDKEKEYHSFVLSADCEENSSLALEYWKGKVMLSEEQANDLLNRLSLDEFNHYVDVIDACERKGKHYKKKSHYQAILDMADRDRRVEVAK